MPKPTASDPVPNVNPGSCDARPRNFQPESPVMKSLKLNLLLAGACFLAAAASTLAQGPTPLLTASEAKHLATLKSDADLKAKADACRELAVIGTPEAIPTLVGLLGDEKLSHMARYALEAMPYPAVGEALRAQLSVLKGRLLAGVIGTLGMRRDVLAVERLIALLDDRDPVVVQAAARALGSIGNVRAAEGLMAAVGSAGGDNFLSICEGLGRAGESLAAQGQRDIALSIYSQAYEDSELPQQVRVASLRGAVLLRGRGGVALLREQLRGSDYLLFAAAVQLALEIPEPGVTQALMAEVGNLAPDRKQVVIQALGERGDPAALPSLLNATTGSSQPVRLAAVRALGSLGHTDAIQTLSRLTADADQEIAQAAKESLASLEGREVDAAALKLLASANANERLTGVELLGRRRMTGNVADLLKAAADEDRRVRVAAVRQVGELGSAAQVPPVLALLTKATDGQDRGAAEQALTTLAAKAATPESASTPVIAALGTAQPEAKIALLNVLASIGGAGALKAVSASAKDGNAEVRAEAVRALSSWKTADAGPALAELAKTAASDGDKTLALRGYLGLAGNPDLPAEQRFKMCQDAGSLIQRPEEKRLLLAALGSVATPEALKLVVPHLDDPAIREEASAAVVGIADRLLRGQGPSPAAAGLIEPLGKVAQVSGNADLVRRAKELAERAKNRANQ